MLRSAEQNTAMMTRREPQEADRITSMYKVRRSENWGRGMARVRNGNVKFNWDRLMLDKSSFVIFPDCELLTLIKSSSIIVSETIQVMILTFS